MCEEAASSTQINGYVSGTIPIHSSVKQGLPISTLLFASCVDLLLRILDQKLTGIRIGKRARKTALVAYADDINIFVTTPTDIPIISDAIKCYKKATGARLNTRKSKVLVVGGWGTSMDTLNIKYHAEIKILGVKFASTTEHSMNNSWANLTGKVRAQPGDTYGRDVSLSQRIRNMQEYLLEKTWHRTQVFPAPTTCTRQVTTVIACYIWKGAMLWVPISTVQKPKRQGGWGLIDIEAKCLAVLIGRTWARNMKRSSATATWLPEWNLDGPRANPLT
jgi:hypothetical protein